MVPKAMRAARQKGRKREGHVIKTTKANRGERARGTSGKLGEKARSERRGREGAEKEGILEAREKPRCGLMA